MIFKNSLLVCAACLAMSATFANPIKSATVTDKDGNLIKLSLQSAKDVKISGKHMVINKDKKFESTSDDAKIEFPFDGKLIVITGKKITVP
jgi:hypothetical protein